MFRKGGRQLEVKQSDAGKLTQLKEVAAKGRQQGRQVGTEVIERKLDGNLRALVSDRAKEARGRARSWQGRRVHRSNGLMALPSHGRAL